MSRRWSVFCRVVDNFGDIGVCWRLARILARHHGVRVRLWLDDPSALRRIAPRAASEPGIEVRPWQAPFDAVAEDEVVIEAFACDLPAEALVAMAGRRVAPCWINLEYLSAEAWVADCHCVPSPHPRLPLVKHFFFPGFDPRTGGLLRECDLFERRDAFRADTATRHTWLAQCVGREILGDALIVSLFAYEQPALSALLTAWASSTRPVLVLVPEGRVVADVARHFGEVMLSATDYRRDGALEVCIVPFSDQDDYDRLLWCADLNFVRGEDSFVRAQWAAAPFVWQPYRQPEDAHRVKLEAFLEVFLTAAEAPVATAVRGFWRAWNGDDDMAARWPQFEAVLPGFSSHCARWSRAQGAREDLATSLVNFSERCV